MRDAIGHARFINSCHRITAADNDDGTAIGGVFMGRDIEFMNTHAYKIFKMLGGNSNPFDAFLLCLGLKTLELRMERHCQNAMEVARFLERQSNISKVNYTGLASHHDHAIAKKQMKHPGGMLSFELKGGIKNGINFLFTKTNG